MNLSDKLTQAVKDAVQSIFNAELESVEIQSTRKDFTRGKGQPCGDW